MDIGLECYISEHSGFCGQLKRFCEDFKVTEIDELGCLVELTSQDIQPDVAKDMEKCYRKVITVSAKNDDNMQPSNSLFSSGSCNAENSASGEKDSSLQPTNKYFYQLADMTSPDEIQKALFKLTDILGEIKMSKLKDMYSNMQTNGGTLNLGCFNNK
ncbi:uncharacterized protein LOC116303138, partial [Actinia tenebrosa]|uniref:Uncharacterized protein LOC116303138 n=1 Tax=Actinia tenebrosa TaxID=6105 RepID=A0A6P8IPU3_ACTTE